MSYCRWSSDNWKSDVYVYEDCGGGWTIHVAARKRQGEIKPPFPDFPADKYDGWETAWLADYKAHLAAVEAATFADIGLPHDGETFNEPTLEDCKARLLELRGIGYHVPDSAIERIDEELVEAKKS